MTTYYVVAQVDPIQSGPMLGYSDMQEAVVWLQLKEPGKAYARFAADTNDAPWRETATVATSASVANTLKLYFTDLHPGLHYRYELVVNEEVVRADSNYRFYTEPLWSYRTDPPAFSFAMGSCAYINEPVFDRPGKPYGGKYEIFKSISRKQPDAMLWLGDNTYLRLADWWTRSGYLHRYTHTRSLPELQPLLAQCNHFAIWDDHEFGPNDATGSWIHKDLALEVFRLFWANHSFGYRDLPGIMSAFRFRDADFILMDNRYYRTEQYGDSTKEQIFGQAQADRMIDLLKQSHAPFKFVLSGGQFLNSAKVYENHANYELERAYILQRIKEERITGVIFLTGDRHHSEVSRMELDTNLVVHDITVSPLTSGPNRNVTETNKYRVAGSLIQQRNFATISISGKFRERHLKLQYFDSKGQLLYEYALKP